MQLQRKMLLGILYRPYVTPSLVEKEIKIIVPPPTPLPFCFKMNMTQYLAAFGLTA